MSIFVNKNTKVLVQGITGREGQFHARQCIAYGTNVVAGVTPGKGGQKMDDVPVFNSVKQAVKEGLVDALATVARRLRDLAPSEEARAVAERMVSTLIGTPAPANAVITGTTRLISSSTSVRAAPGRVDSPPTSIRSAPSAISA